MSDAAKEFEEIEKRWKKACPSLWLSSKDCRYPSEQDNIIRHANSDVQTLLAAHRKQEERVRELQQERAEAAMEINCAGPLVERIKILKMEFTRNLEIAEERADQAEARVRDMEARITRLSDDYDFQHCREAELTGYIIERAEQAEADLKLNASMLAKQCDLAREAEIKVKELETSNKRMGEAIEESLADNLPYLTEQRLKKALEPK